MIYEPAEDSWLLADVLANKQLEGREVLEIGCGSGFLTKILADKKAIVTAIDINPAAVEATKKLVPAARVFESDLFENVRGKFDLIVFNPPYLPENEEDVVVGSDARYSGGSTGRAVIEKFIKQSKKHLKIGGKILLLISSATGEQDVLSEFIEYGFTARAIASKKIDWEELFVLEAVRKTE